jgi:hypothetical protein
MFVEEISSERNWYLLKQSINNYSDCVSRSCIKLIPSTKDLVLRLMERSSALREAKGNQS